MSAVVELDASLEELAETIRREHRLCFESAGEVLQHAIACGDALLQARDKVGRGNWERWLADNAPDARTTSRNYIRLAYHKIAVADASSIGQGLRLISNAPPLPMVGSEDRVRVEHAAREMRGQGMLQREIAEELGLTQSMVSFILETPQQRQRRTKRNREAIAKRRKIAKALRDMEREQAIKRAARNAGGADAELYAMAERMQDVMGRAHREATDPEKRRHYAEAGVHYRKMRDEIVRALGVS